MHCLASRGQHYKTDIRQTPETWTFFSGNFSIFQFRKLRNLNVSRAEKSDNTKPRQPEGAGGAGWGGG